MEERFKIHTGVKGHYIYDYKLYDVVRKDGKFFTTKERVEAERLIFSMPQEHLYHEINEKGQKVNVWK